MLKKSKSDTDNNILPFIYTLQPLPTRGNGQRLSRRNPKSYLGSRGSKIHRNQK